MGRVTSIARKINLGNLWQQFTAYVGIDLLVIVVMTAVFVVGMDWQMTGRFSPYYIRGIVYGNSLWELVYEVSDTGGNLLYKVPMGGWIYLLLVGGIVVLTAELVDILSLAFKGTKRVRRQLRPLNEIAARAQ